MLRCCFAAFTFLMLCPVSRADDNFLGLPRPADPARPGAVVLHGGGRITEDVFNRFWELAGGKEAHIVLVPSAGFRPSDFGSEAQFLARLNSRYSSWVALEKQGWIKSFQFLYTDDPTHADDAAFVRPLERATGVWFSGGAQSRLNYRYVGRFPRQTRFQQSLLKVLERGGVVGGTSAGMAALPEIMTIRQHYESSDSPATAVACHGLGLFTGAIVEQHFDSRGGRLERFTSLMRDNEQLDRLAGRKRVGENMMGIAVEERTALVASGNRLQVLGDGSVHVFLKSHGGRTLAWHQLATGDSAQLLRDVPDRVALAREELLLSQ